MAHHGHADRAIRIREPRPVEELAIGVVGAAAVTHRDVHLAVGPERQVAAVMVELRPVHPQELAPAGRIDHGRRVAGVEHAPLGDDVLVVRRVGWNGAEKGRRARFGLRGVGVEQAILSVLGMERDTQETPLVEAVGAAHAEFHEPRRHVEECRPGVVAQVDGPQDAGLVDDKEAVRLPGGSDALERRGQPGCDDLDANARSKARDRSEPSVVIWGEGRVRHRGRGWNQGTENGERD